jgi:hypothetical protein
MSEECSTCGGMFGSPSELVQHMKTAHPHEAPAERNELNPEAEKAGFVCGLCGERFPTPAALSAHNLSRPERRRAAEREAAAPPV